MKKTRAVFACALIWVGLATRNRMRRVLGFVLFALTAGKVLVYDMQTLEKVYRIVSFMGTGLLGIVASMIYQRYSKTLLARPEEVDSA